MLPDGCREGFGAAQSAMGAMYFAGEGVERDE